MAGASTRRIVVTGATGLIGRRLCALLRQKSYAVTAVSRNPAQAEASGVSADSFVAWENPEGTDPPAQAVAGAHAVVHLLGETVNPGFGGRWTDSKKASIMSSRVLSTKHLVQGMKAAGTAAPKIFICGSAIGWYGERGADEVYHRCTRAFDWPILFIVIIALFPQLGEDEPAGDDFLANVSINWEREAKVAEELGIRVAQLRTGNFGRRKQLS